MYTVTSLTGRKWMPRHYDVRQGLAIAQRLGVSETIGKILSARHIPLEEAPHFLEPTLLHYLPNPSILKDMDRAAKRIGEAIMNTEKIGLLGDYDVDGATSVSLISSFISAAGGTSTYYIPDRIKEGYGPSKEGVTALKKAGATLMLTLDCGTVAYEPLAFAKEERLDVIVVDHHIGEPKLPDVFAVVNPNRLDEENDLKDLAAVGVTFLLVVAINRFLREENWYKSTKRKEPNLKSLLDLVALGTVCDVVSLQGLNRAFVTQGLKVLGKRQNIGLRALSDLADLDSAPDAYTLGFILGPRINAGGRVGRSTLGTEVLLAQNPEDANPLAAQLDRLNFKRQEIEKKALFEATEQVEAMKALPSVLVVSNDGWHAGVIGIIASRLKEKYHRPCFIISFSEGEDAGKGSGRSVTGFDMGNAVISAKQKELITHGGGHAMAAGLTIDKKNLHDFQVFMNEEFLHQTGEIALTPELKIDGTIPLQAASLSLCETLEKLKPFGMGHAEPRFVFENVRIVKTETMGKTGEHMRCFLVDTKGKMIRAVAFRVTESGLGKSMLNENLPVRVAGKVRNNRWQGRDQLQILIDDIAGM
ncbi:MAG: single-stranded-DNA-specific exonuclease RecJ [Alphaproteobacteria bacterium]